MQRIRTNRLAGFLRPYKYIPNNSLTEQRNNKVLDDRSLTCFDHADYESEVVHLHLLKEQQRLKREDMLSIKMWYSHDFSKNLYFGICRWDAWNTRIFKCSLMESRGNTTFYLKKREIRHFAL